MPAQRSFLFDETTPLQKLAGILSLVFSFIGLILLVNYLSMTENGGLGGIDWNQHLFNYHPVLMYSGMILGSMSAILTYRLLPFEKYVTKTIHGSIHAAAVICIILGLIAVFVGNNDKSHNTDNKYYPNIFSLHSFLGLGTIMIYFLNFALGAIHFLPSIQMIPVDLRQAYMPYHAYVGSLSVFAAAMTVVTGIMELTTENGCTYDVDSPNTNSAANYYSKINLGCKLANGVGVIVLVSVALFYFAIGKFVKNEASLPRDDADRTPLL